MCVSVVCIVNVCVSVLLGKKGLDLGSLYKAINV